MSDKSAGSIAWADLTTTLAPQLREFYEQVAGWRADPVPMDGGAYNDFNMIPAAEGAQPVAGICHATGANAGLPPVWLLYVLVDDLDHSLAQCTALGGTVVRPPAGAKAPRFAVIRDPAGAHLALYQAK